MRFQNGFDLTVHYHYLGANLHFCYQQEDHCIPSIQIKPKITQRNIIHFSQK